MYKFIITSPINMNIEDWVGFISDDLLPLEVPIFEGDWRNWAYSLFENPQFINVPIPSKVLYPHENDWIKWSLDWISCGFQGNSF